MKSATGCAVIRNVDR